MARTQIFEHTETHEIDGQTIMDADNVSPQEFYKAHIWVGYPNSMTINETFARLHLADKTTYKWSGDPLIVDIDTDIDPQTETRWEVE